MHSGRVVPKQEWLVRRMGAIDEIERTRKKIILNRFHALARHWSGILDGLLAYLPETRIFGRVVNSSRPAIQHATRFEKILKCWMVFWIVRLLRLLFGVQMIKIAKKLVETVNRR